MIIKRPFERGIIDGKPGFDTQYFGKDAKDFLENINWHDDVENIGKECITNNLDRGIIVGFEDSESAGDYYFIVFVPRTGEVTYELANSRSFIESIE